MTAGAASGAPPACTLCASPATSPFAPSPATHVDCPACGIVTLRVELHPSEEQERARYLLHRNSPEDAGYRAFLARLADPLVDRVERGAEGLDFGCGPGPTLSAVLEERGLSVRLHDPLFAPNPAALAHTWAFVTCTEVVEHLRDPRATWREMAGLVRSGGWLAVMTQPLTPARERDFAAWAYARDPTHVALYRPGALDWIAAWLGLRLDRPREDVFLFHARGVDDPSGAASVPPG